MSSHVYYSDADSASASDTGNTRHRKNRTKKSRKRPARPRPNYDDLVICGYGSNLFRNDDLACAIEKGDMLVRWRDNEALNLTIDR